MSGEEIKIDQYFARLSSTVASIKSRFSGNTDLYKVYKKSDTQSNYYRVLFKSPTSISQAIIKMIRINNFIMVEDIIEVAPLLGDKTVILKNDPLFSNL